jgi:hypothetical protein
MASERQAEDTDHRGKIVSKFKVYWNKPTNKRVVILQYPDRERTNPYNAINGTKPLQLRIKPKTGLVEIDVPLDAEYRTFDKAKALEHGEALKRNKVIQQGGSFGLAGGFGIGQLPSRTRGANKDDSERPPFDDYDTALKEGYVLNYLTLGGRIQALKDGDAMYALGSFKGGNHFSTYIYFGH